jgi:hypothetical protein
MKKKFLAGSSLVGLYVGCCGAAFDIIMHDNIMHGGRVYAFGVPFCSAAGSLATGDCDSVSVSEHWCAGQYDVYKSCLRRQENGTTAER